MRPAVRENSQTGGGSATKNRNMKTNLSFAIALAALVFTTGCETPGMSRREQANVTYPSYILNLRPKPSSEAPAKIVTPLRLAVVQVGEPAPPKAMLDRLQSNGSLVASVVGLPSWSEGRCQTNNMELAADKVKAVCLLAQSVGADYVFLFGGNMDSWCDGNSMRFLDLTLVGAALVPSTKIYTEGKAAGTLIDAAAREATLLVSVDAKRTAQSPTWLADGKTDTLRAALRDDLNVSLADELLRTLIHRRTLAATSSVQTR